MANRRIEVLNRVHNRAQKDPDYPRTCFTTSAVAAGQAGLKLYRGEFVVGSGQGETHHWCEDDQGNRYDLTASQFNKYLVRDEFADGVNVITPDDPRYKYYQNGEPFDISPSLFARAWKAIFSG